MHNPVAVHIEQPELRVEISSGRVGFGAERAWIGDIDGEHVDIVCRECAANRTQRGVGVGSSRLGGFGQIACIALFRPVHLRQRRRCERSKCQKAPE